MLGISIVLDRVTRCDWSRVSCLVSRFAFRISHFAFCEMKGCREARSPREHEGQLVSIKPTCLKSVDPMIYDDHLARLTTMINGHRDIDVARGEREPIR